MGHFFFSIRIFDVLFIKGGLVEETLMYKFLPYSQFEFSFPDTLYLPF